jgi:hypothetical protein
MREITKHLDQDNKTHGKRLETTISRYESGLLTTHAIALNTVQCRKEEHVGESSK